jgi:hypothetical protein
MAYFHVTQAMAVLQVKSLADSWFDVVLTTNENISVPFALSLSKGTPLILHLPI